MNPLLIGGILILGGYAAYKAYKLSVATQTIEQMQYVNKLNELQRNYQAGIGPNAPPYATENYKGVTIEYRINGDGKRLDWYAPNGVKGSGYTFLGATGFLTTELAQQDAKRTIDAVLAGKA